MRNDSIEYFVPLEEHCVAHRNHWRILVAAMGNSVGAAVLCMGLTEVVLVPLVDDGLLVDTLALLIDA